MHKVVRALSKTHKFSKVIEHRDTALSRSSESVDHKYFSAAMGVDHTKWVEKKHAILDSIRDAGYTLETTRQSGSSLGGKDVAHAFIKKAGRVVGEIHFPHPIPGPNQELHFIAKRTGTILDALRHRQLRSAIVRYLAPSNS